MKKTYMEKIIEGKKIKKNNKKIIKCLVLCNLSHNAIFPLINYHASQIDTFIEFMTDNYSNYLSYISFNSDKIKEFSPDFILIIHDESFYLDKFGICLSINKVKDNIDHIKKGLENIVEILHVEEKGIKIVSTSLPYLKKRLQHYISLDERKNVLTAIGDFLTYKDHHPLLSYTIDIGDFTGGYVESVYKEHNTLASLALLDEISSEFIKTLRLQSGQSLKCIITDLDNTFWDGVAADDRIERILNSKRKNEFDMYQRWLARMHEQGVILAIASKNDEKFIKEIFEKNASSFQVEWDKFAAKKINWLPKSQNIHQLCNELNISSEHVLFIDDSRFECEEVQSHVTGITLFRFSSNIRKNVEDLAEKSLFVKEKITHSDAIRNQTYVQNVLRNSHASTSHSHDDFLKKLKMILSCSRASESIFDRISELTLRTNQFNMTLLRMNVQSVRTFIKQPGNTVLVYSCRDHYGDFGVIGSAFITINHSVCTIVNIVMSCRVFGRHVEHAILETIINFARKNGCKSIDCSFVETNKNTLFKEFYQENGFRSLSKNQYQFNVMGNHILKNNKHVTIETIEESISEH